MTKNTKHICADATYKLIQHGYPVLVVGTTDRDKKFHPFGVAMCCNETEDAFKFIFKSIKDCVQEIYQYDYQPTILVADAAEAITNGFTSVFLELLFRVMCWFQMKKAFGDHETFTSINQPHKENIRQDICTLQLCESKDIFDAAYQLFKKKWTTMKDGGIKDFLIYFDKTWIQQHPGWYEGFAPGVPSTNNALESNNGKIKDQATYRTKHSLGRFLEIVQKDMIERWSKERDETKPYCKYFSKKPTINHSLWVEAHRMNVDDRLTSAIKVKNQTTIYMSSGRLDGEDQPLINSKNITKETKTYKEFKQKKNWNSFDCYNDSISRFWQISFKEDADEWNNGSTCNCGNYQKNYICKHLVLQAIRLNFVTVPLTAQTNQLEDMPKRGRKPTISKA